MEQPNTLELGQPEVIASYEATLTRQRKQADRMQRALTKQLRTSVKENKKAIAQELRNATQNPSVYVQEGWGSHLSPADLPEAYTRKAPVQPASLWDKISKYFRGVTSWRS